MSKTVLPKSAQSTFRRYTGVILLLSISLGVLASLVLGWYVHTHTQTMLRQRALDIANSLPADTIASLSGSAADLQTPAYLEIKDKLARISTTNSTVRSAQVIGQHKDELFVYANSAAITSAAYIAPGERLSEPTDELKTLQTSRKAYAAGPVTVSDETYYQGVAPIIESTTGDYIGAVIISMPAFNYYAAVLGAFVTPLILVGLPVAAIIRDHRIQRKEFEITKLKSHFVAVASHELRSPLGGILWAVQSLLKPSVKNLTIEQQVILLDMYQSAEESLTTINEILDLSAFDRNEPKSKSKEKVQISTIVKNATKTLRLSANERGIKFSFVGKWDDDNTYTIGDASALKRMFMNLIANAIKYGRDETEISLRLSQKDGYYLVAVEDHGIGIPLTDQRRVLDGYYRAKNAQETQKAGTGIGLLLAKLVAEQHGGKLWLTSKEGRGTTVFVTLPDEETARTESTTSRKSS